MIKLFLLALAALNLASDIALAQSAAPNFATKMPPREWAATKQMNIPAENRANENLGVIKNYVVIGGRLVAGVLVEKDGTNVTIAFNQIEFVPMIDGLEESIVDYTRAQLSSMPPFDALKPGEMLLSGLVACSVYNANNDKIGDNSDEVIAPDGSIDLTFFDVGTFLAAGHKDVAVPFASLELEPSSDGQMRLVANLTKAQLAAAPSFFRVPKKKKWSGYVASADRKPC